jgi:5-methylcytosine-specific restriction endonuclease McrA
MSRGWSGGSTRKWRRTRQQVLERDGYRCQLKLDGCTTRATHVHHVYGKGGGDDPAGLLSSCEHCNLKVGDPTRTDPTPKRPTKW